MRGDGLYRIPRSRFWYFKMKENGRWRGVSTKRVSYEDAKRARRTETSNGKAKPIVLWTLAAILLIIVFFAVRRLTREQLPLRVAQATMQDLTPRTAPTARLSHSLPTSRRMPRRRAL